MSGREVVREQVVLDHEYLHVRLDTVRGECGEHTYVCATGPDIAHVVPLWPDGTVTLVRQVRHGFPEPSLEVAGGHVDPGETPVAAAARELREETGLVAGKLTPLVTFFPSVKLQQPFHVFLAEDLTDGDHDRDADEEIELLRMPLADAARLALTGGVGTAPAIVALAAAREFVAAR